MDGENNGKPYEQMDDLGGPPLFLETPNYSSTYYSVLGDDDPIWHDHVQPGGPTRR